MVKQLSPKTEDERRHLLMSRIRSKDTQPEIILRRALWHKGIRYRKNYKAIPGTPDIAITKYRIAVFCDGEFWHGKDWECKKQRLHNNKDYWISKIERNMQRDQETDKRLAGMGWIVLHFWGDDIKKNTTKCIDEIEEIIFQITVDAHDNAADRCESIDE